MKHVSFLVWFYIEMLFPIWYHLYNLKNLKNTYGGVSLLVKLQASGSVGVFYVFSTVQMLPNCGPSDEWWVNQYLAPVSLKKICKCNGKSTQHIHTANQTEKHHPWNIIKRSSIIVKIYCPNFMFTSYKFS